MSFTQISDRPTPAKSTSVIDFSRSIPPMPPAFGSLLQGTLASLAGRAEIASLTRNSVSGGTAADRDAARLWLTPRLSQSLTSDRIIVTNGTQSALLLLFETLVGQGGLLAAESLSYGVLSQLAARAHVRVCGLPLDSDGIEPSAFERICQTQRPKALYCNPTAHNPTATMMSAGRRARIAEIASHFGVAIIEDEPLGCLHPDAPPPIALTAPDVTWYIAGLTKGLAHGFRIAYIVGPTAEKAGALLRDVDRLSWWFPAPLSALTVRDWIVSGHAARIRDAISEEATQRERMAREILGRHDLTIQSGGLHAWLRLPHGVDRRTMTRRLAKDGVVVRPSDAFAIGTEQDDVEAIRISLSSPLERADVKRGLGIIASALEGRG